MSVSDRYIRKSEFDTFVQNLGRTSWRSSVEAAPEPIELFTLLFDTPISYTDEAAKFVQVNAAEDALEFNLVTAEDVQAGTFPVGDFKYQGDVWLSRDSDKLRFGAVNTDYTIEWDGSDAVHTVVAGDFVFTGGNVGIGTAVTTYVKEGDTWGVRLMVVGDSGAGNHDDFALRRDHNTAFPRNTFLRARAGPAAVADDDWLGVTMYRGHDGTDYNDCAGIYARVDGAVAANTVPTELIFCTTTGNSPTERLIISPVGHMWLIGDDKELRFGNAINDYTIQWDGNDAVHTIVAGDFKFMGGMFGVGLIPLQKFELGSTDNSKRISIYHDNTDAFLKWDYGRLVLQTDEGANTDTILEIRGKGTGSPILTSEVATHLLVNPTAAWDGGVKFFSASTQGPELTIHGYVAHPNGYGKLHLTSSGHFWIRQNDDDYDLYLGIGTAINIVISEVSANRDQVLISGYTMLTFGGGVPAENYSIGYDHADDTLNFVQGEAYNTNIRARLDATGLFHFYEGVKVYGYITAGDADRFVHFKMDDTNDEFLIQAENNANHEGITIDLLEANQMFRVRGGLGSYFVNKVGIGTEVIPHGGIGIGKFAIDGLDSDTAGPHVQFTTASDDYPLMTLYNWSHDDIALLFDCYYDGGAFASSYDGSSFAIIKGRGTANTLRIVYDVENAGDGIDWNDAIIIDTSGIVSMPAVYGHDMDGETIRLMWINDSGELGYDSNPPIPSKTTAAWNKSIGATGDYSDWAAMIAAMPDLIAHAVTVEIEIGTTLTEMCELKNKHGITKDGEIIIRSERYYPTATAIPTADSATATTLRDAVLAAEGFGNDYFNDCWILIVDGMGTDNGFVKITDYIDATGDVVVAGWATQPDNTSRYIIVGALVDATGESYGLWMNSNSCSIRLYGIGFKDSNVYGLSAQGCLDVKIFDCGVYNSNRAGVYINSCSYITMDRGGIVKNNVIGHVSHGGMTLAATNYINLTGVAVSDNNGWGIYIIRNTFCGVGNLFGDNNGAWGTYCKYSAQAYITGVECSGAGGNHSDPGTAGDANADQAAAY